MLTRTHAKDRRKVKRKEIVQKTILHTKARCTSCLIVSHMPVNPAHIPSLAISFVQLNYIFYNKLSWSNSPRYRCTRASFAHITCVTKKKKKLKICLFFSCVSFRFFSHYSFISFEILTFPILILHLCYRNAIQQAYNVTYCQHAIWTRRIAGCYDRCFLCKKLCYCQM